MTKKTNVVPRKAIWQWMNNESVHYMLDQLTSVRSCNIIGLRGHVQAAANKYWVPQMEEISRKAAHDAQKLIQKQALSDKFIARVRRTLRDDDKIVTHLVNDLYFDVEEHWDDADYMHEHRQKFMPNSQHKSVAVVVSDFDKHAGTAAMERLGKGGHGVNKHIKLASVDAQNREVPSEEWLEEVGRSCGQSELTRKRFWDSEVFRGAFLRVVGD